MTIQDIIVITILILFLLGLLLSLFFYEFEDSIKLFYYKSIQKRWTEEELKLEWERWLENKEVDYISLDGKSFINYLVTGK